MEEGSPECPREPDRPLTSCRTLAKLTHSELARERAWSRIYLVPAILAEQDRDAYRRNVAALEREKQIMKDVPGWEVSTRLLHAGELLHWKRQLTNYRPERASTTRSTTSRALSLLSRRKVSDHAALIRFSIQLGPNASEARVKGKPRSEESNKRYLSEFGGRGRSWLHGMRGRHTKGRGGRGNVARGAVRGSRAGFSCKEVRLFVRTRT